MMKTLKKLLQSAGRMFKRLFVPEKDIRNILEEEALASPGKLVAKKFFRSKLAMIGMVGFVLMIVFTFGLSIFIPLDLFRTSAHHANLPPDYSYLNFPRALEKEGVAMIDSGVAFSIG
jgi:peptide/nickel transport system permease protein